jgi:hypothetical protein
MYFALQYHIVRSPQGMHVVPRGSAGLGDIYADVRDWSLDDWQRHPDLIQDLVRDGKGEIVPASSGRSLLRDFFDGFDRANR